MINASLTTLGKNGEFRLTEKKSEFIGYASPVDSEAEALAFINGIKEKHSDARHNVSAYVVGGAAHASDDGEPQGTGGIPVLDVIRKNGIDNAVIVVTRYFGGILLGAGGLLRAYSRAAAGAVEDAGMITYDKFIECFFECAYGDYEKLTYEAGKFTSIIDGTDFSSAVTVRLAVLHSEFNAFSAKIGEMTGGKVTLNTSGERFDAKRT